MIGQKRLALVLLVLLPIVGLSAAAYAQGFQSGNDVTVAAGQQLNKTLFVAGQTVDIAGTVNGDLFCAAQNISVTGTINGDVICAGQSVQISGLVNGNVRVIGQNITVDGTISRNISAAGQNVTLGANSKVTGDASIASQTIVDNGSIGRDLVVAANSVTINGQVDRNVQSVDASLTLGNEATISGNINYTSKHLLTKVNGSKVAGTISQTIPKQTRFGWLSGHRWWLELYLFVALMIAALVVVLLLPQVLQMASGVAIVEPLKTFLIGLVVSIVTPVVIVLLCITVIGMPLAVVLLLLWLSALVLSAPVVAYYLGRLLLHRVTNNAIYFMLLGAVLLLILLILPIIKILVILLTVWFGLGMICLQLRRLPKINYHTAVAITVDDSTEKPHHQLHR